MPVIILTTVLTLSALYAPQPLLPVIMQQFAVSRQAAAFLTTVTFMPLSVAPLFYGYLLESLSPRRMLRVAVLLLAVSEIFFFFGRSFPVLVGIRLLQGLLVPDGPGDAGGWSWFGFQFLFRCPGRWRLRRGDGGGGVSPPDAVFDLVADPQFDHVLGGPGPRGGFLGVAWPSHASALLPLGCGAWRSVIPAATRSLAHLPVVETADTLITSASKFPAPSAAKVSRREGSMMSSSNSWIPSHRSQSS